MSTYNVLNKYISFFALKLLTKMEISEMLIKTGQTGNSLVVQWLGLHASTAGGPGLIPGWGTKIPRAAGRLSPHVVTTELIRLN